MRKAKWSAMPLLVLLFFIVAPAKTQSQNPNHNGGVDPAWPALAGSMEQMHSEMMSVTQSKSSDVDFVRLMLPHHQAAIEMAKAQLLYGTDPQMRRLAQEIITDQKSEIELMQLWLKQHEASGGSRQTTLGK